MATARKSKPRPTSTEPPRTPSVSPPVPPESDHWILRAFDAVYRFLASVKLAVLCIFTLAMVLAAATFFESSYGIPAVRQYFYQNKAFAVLLAFLGTNIFCAATIRFPWKKRQTGFVVTHIGLLVILAGAFVSLSASDEGQLGMPEGTKSNELVRINDSVILVQKQDAKTGQWADRYTFHLDHGAFSWHSDELRKLANDGPYQARVWFARAAFVSASVLLLAYLYVWIFRRPEGLNIWVGSALLLILMPITAGTAILVAATPGSPRREVLTDASDPFTLAVTDYLASSGIRELQVEDDPEGEPAAKVSLLVTPPGQKTQTDFLEGRNWFQASKGTFYRRTRPGSPATISYQFAEGPEVAEIVDDFLHPPKNPNVDKSVRIHYRDLKNAPRVYEWRLNEAKPGDSVLLPDSDLKMSFNALIDNPTSELPVRESFESATGETVMHIANLSVKKGAGPDTKLMAIASLRDSFKAGGNLPDGLESVSYFHPPSLTAKGAGMGGALAKVEILHVAGGRVYVRAFGRDGLMGKPEEVKFGTTLPLIASVKMPMQIAVRVDDARDKAALRYVYLPYEIAREDRDKAVPAVQTEMTVKGVTKKISLLHPVNLLPDAQRWETVTFPNATYRVSFDWDRVPFPFALKLNKFEPGRDPGSDNPATFRSDVTLNDEEQNVREEDRAIYMNNPLTHRGWSFYQSNYFRVDDPDTGKKDGAYASVFQVHYDPAWKIIYFGCALVVLGTFLQFYMRAGLFSDGGKRERARTHSAAESGENSRDDL